MRRKLIAANWKMYGSQLMTDEFLQDLADHLEGGTGEPLSYDVLICPPALYVAQAVAKLDSEESAIMVGGQNMSEHAEGAYTAELSAAMLADCGARYVLIGHSERRALYGESNELVAQKFKACASFNTGDAALTPVLCVGETIEQRRAGETEAVIADQINLVIEQTGIDAFSQAVIAYEPVWAIGTGETASPDQAQEIHALIRKLLSTHSVAVAEKIRILYGGSVKPENAKELFAQTDIDGGLVGGASLKVESFAAICKAAG